MSKFTITITRAQLRAALIFAADKDIRYYLNAVLLEVGECGDCRLVATDGHRLAVLAVGDQPGALAGEYLIPREVIKPIKRAGRLTPATVDIEIEPARSADGNTGGRVLVRCGDDIIAGGALVDGKFPDWQRVIPEPSRMSGEPAAYNAFYLGDIGAALVELGDKYPVLELKHNGTSAGLAIYPQHGLMVAVMPMRGSGFDLTDAARAHFLPRRPVFSAIVETAAGGQAYPCDPLQDVSDKRARPADIDTPAQEVVAHCTADIAAWIDPAGALQAAGLLVVAHLGDASHRQPSVRTILRSGASARHGTRVDLIHATAGTESAGAGTRETGEKWGAIFDHSGTTSGTWYGTEAEARAEFERVTAAEAQPAADDAEYLEYLASLQPAPLAVAA